jgi:hypothetical protein
MVHPGPAAPLARQQGRRRAPPHHMPLPLLGGALGPAHPPPGWALQSWPGVTGCHLRRSERCARAAASLRGAPRRRRCTWATTRWGPGLGGPAAGLGASLPGLAWPGWRGPAQRRARTPASWWRGVAHGSRLLPRGGGGLSLLGASMPPRWKSGPHQPVAPAGARCAAGRARPGRAPGGGGGGGAAGVDQPPGEGAGAGAVGRVRGQVRGALLLPPRVPAALAPIARRLAGPRGARPEPAARPWEELVRGCASGPAPSYGPAARLLQGEASGAVLARGDSTQRQVRRQAGLHRRGAPGARAAAHQVLPQALAAAGGLAGAGRGGAAMPAASCPSCRRRRQGLAADCIASTPGAWRPALLEDGPRRGADPAATPEPPPPFGRSCRCAPSGC